MALPVKDQLKYWGLAAFVFLIVLWTLGNVMLPFVVAGALAYMLDPLADRLEAVGLSRVLSTCIISFAALFIFVAIALLVIPVLIEQSVELFSSAREFLANLPAEISKRYPALLDEDSTLRKSLVSLGETIQSKGTELARTVFSSALGVINAVVFIVVVPVVAFYLLLDWDHMVERIDDMLPRDHAPIIRRLASEIDQTLSNFVRGQLTVCAILGTLYALGLALVGLNFGLVVGIVAGLISFIPYIGALVGGALALGIALVQFWDAPQYIVLVAVIFAIGQFLEGNFLTPKLVGGSVGLHPVWLLLALSVFGALFGFVGMLVAVPLAASIGVLTRFAVSQYQTSRLYSGLEHSSARKTDYKD